LSMFSTKYYFELPRPVCRVFVNYNWRLATFGLKLVE